MRIALHRGGRHQDHAAFFLLQQSCVHELIREKLIVRIVEGGAQLYRAGGLIDLVVDGGQRAGCQLDLHVAIKGVHRQLLAGPLLGVHGRQLILGDGENDADGLKLGDHQESGAVAGLNDVAGIHQPEADAPGDGRGDVAIDQIDLHRLNQTLIVLDYSFVGLDGSDLRGKLLLGDGVLLDERFITRLVDAGVVERGLIAQQLPFILRQLGFIRAGIDLGQRVALLHDVALFVEHLH